MQYEPKPVLVGQHKSVFDLSSHVHGMCCGLRLLCLLVISVVSGCSMSSAPARLDLHSVPVAVWDLDNLTPGQGTRPDMGEFLSAGIIQVLQERAGLDVVERERIVQILEELRLGSGELASQDTRLRLGRMAGARCMVFGGYQEIGGKVRFDLRLVDVETGKVLATSSRTVASLSMDEWLPAVQQAALDLVIVK